MHNKMKRAIDALETAAPLLLPPLVAAGLQYLVVEESISWIGIAVAAVLGMAATASDDTLVEGCVFTLFLSVLVIVFLSTGSFSPFVRQIVLSAAAGLGTGKILGPLASGNI